MLTNAAVKAARRKPCAYKIADGQGLYLHVAPGRWADQVDAVLDRCQKP